MSNRRDKWDKLRRQSKVWTHGSDPLAPPKKNKRKWKRILKAMKRKKGVAKWRLEWYGRNLT